jgi:hypothetical protein
LKRLHLSYSHLNLPLPSGLRHCVSII